MKVTLGNVAEVREHLRVFPYLAADTETTGLSETDVPFAVIIASPQREYYFRPDNRECPLWACLYDIFAQPGTTWIFQNAKFDMRMLSTRNIDIPGPVIDIAIAARILDNSHMSYSLSAQAKRAGLQDKKDDEIKAHIKMHNYYEERTDFFGKVEAHPRYDWVDHDLMEQYACTDARLTFDLYQHYSSLLDSSDRAVLQNEMELTKVCYYMERHGVRLDKMYALQAFHAERHQVETLKQRYMEHTGRAYTNSAKSIGACISARLPLTEEGNPSLTDDVVEDLLGSDIPQKDKDILEVVRSIRFFDKRTTTYYASYLNKVDRVSRIHPTMWQAGTRTGRFSYSDPNLQNIPKEDDAEYKVRRCFIPTPGNILLSYDYSQMEYRMMAAYANEKHVIKEVMNGADFHQTTADLLGIPRKQAKTLNFAILYGAGIGKIANMLDCAPAEAKRLKTKYFLGLPRVESLVDSIIRTGRSRGYVSNWLGRKLRAEYDTAYALPNHLIQGGGADVVKRAMVQLYKAELHNGLCLQIHDQLVWDVPREWAKAYHQEIKEILENIWTMNNMKLVVDMSWSDKSLAEEDMTKEPL